MRFKTTIILSVLFVSLLMLLNPTDSLAESGLCVASGGVKYDQGDKNCNYFTHTYYRLADCNDSSMDSRDTHQSCDSINDSSAACHSKGGVKRLLNKICMKNTQSFWQYLECNNTASGTAYYRPYNDNLSYDDTGQHCNPSTDPNSASALTWVMYSLNPSPADPNTDLTVTFPSIVIPNQACVALFQDGTQTSCYLDRSVPNGLKCTVNSGNPGTHTLQLKYGQSSLYPGVNCGIPTAGNTYTYTTTGTTSTPVPTSSPSPEYTVKYQVAYDNLPTDWGTIPEQDYTSDNLRIRHTFSSTPGDKFIFVKFKTNKGREEVHQLRVALVIANSSSPSPSAGSVIFPTSSFSVSATTLNAGQQLTLSASANPSSGNSINSVEFYFASPETLIDKCTSSPCTKTWTPTMAGTYQVYVDVHDSAGRKCSNNPSYGGYTTTNPNGWAKCGSSAALITVNPAPSPAGQACTAAYNTTPQTPIAGGTFSLAVDVNDTPNVNCVVFYRDGVAIPAQCGVTIPAGGSGGHFYGSYSCSGVNAGSAGSHTIQAKFGQASYYPAGTPCKAEVVCNQASYTAQ